ncbi:MAG: tRNA 4-thiouridine(8) synthase ThiI [Bacteroidetes bacterium]|nr:tRNA 4-thiouridine(8) synthase ThiI [Rhodothermia bacterium]MCX7907311.1 tRNA 4-thiouridine(8) synthase ThiI [Bacteroidota bacterium]MDW8137962.1 tRNA uracil 4-sulfurtransferase ThiI [Bacteroidota bacterium]MDW8286186.1 tRNA uracil 4-sulfurtransferase ThiI [Bacteroidota bacterium]
MKQDCWRKLVWDGLAVHYHEIALKGQNRRFFRRRLLERLQAVLADQDLTVQDRLDHLFIPLRPDHLDEALQRTSRVFGVAYAVPVRLLPRSAEAMVEAALALYHTLSGPDRPAIAVRVHRSDKGFPLSSRELERLIGRRLVEVAGAPVRLSQPDLEIRFRVQPHAVYLLGPKWRGPGGLPVGVTGRVLVLFSGGIDSSVVGWLLMRRGCTVDFVHFHAFPSAEPVRTSKIPQMIAQLVRDQGLRARLFAVPYHVFQLALLAHPVPPDLELVLFRRFMVRVASRLARAHGYRALATGDNLGQVASQTLESLIALEEAAELPVFRPLLTYNKPDIIALAQQIGTYRWAVQPYKDCCSLIARRPDTRPRLERVHEAEARLPLEEMIGRTLRSVVFWRLPEDGTQSSQASAEGGKASARPQGIGQPQAQPGQG